MEEMNNSSENSTFFFENDSYEIFKEDVMWGISVLELSIVLLGFLLNSYVIWLIVRGTGSGLTAEFFNLNLSICEILGVEAVVSFFCTGCTTIDDVLYFLNGLSFTARPLFQCVICVERYLAVVHPVTFLKYKPLRYRLICCGMVWVTGAVCGGIRFVMYTFILAPFIHIFNFAQFLLFVSIQLFCLAAVLRALKRSGPGERNREKEESQMKRRAFNLILITSMTVLISVSLYMITVILFFYFISETHLAFYIFNFIYIIGGWVQPLFFLYRMGKPPFIKCQ